MVRLLLSVGCALAFALLPTVANAQSPGPSPTVVRGSVRDASGAPLAGVAISATPGSPVSTPAVTKQNGEYALTVPAGHHELRAWLGGFEEAVQSVTSGSAKDARVDFVLQLAIVREVVDVVAHTGYQTAGGRTATKTPTLLRDVPQSVTVVTEALIKDQMMMSMGDVLRYVPGVMVHQGENNRDQVIIRGNSSSADFFVDGVRDDVQYYRDLYNLERVETLKGPNALIFGRGGAGGVVNRVPKSAGVRPTREVAVQGGMFGNKRASAGINQPLGEKVALRLDGMFEDSGSFRDSVGLTRRGVTPTLTYNSTDRTKVTLRHEYLLDHRTADRGITSFRGAPADVDSSTFYGDPDASYVTASVHVSSGTVEHLLGAATVRNHTLVANYDRSYQNFVPGAATPDGTRVALTAYNNTTNRTQPLQPDRPHLHGEDRTCDAHHAGGRRVRPATHRQPAQHGVLQQHHDLTPRPVLEPDALGADHVPSERHRCRQSPDDDRRRCVRAGSGGVVTSPAGCGRRARRSLHPHLPQQPQW